MIRKYIITGMYQIEVLADVAENAVKPGITVSVPEIIVTGSGTATIKSAYKLSNECEEKEVPL